MLGHGELVIGRLLGPGPGVDLAVLLADHGLADRRLRDLAAPAGIGLGEPEMGEDDLGEVAQGGRLVLGEAVARLRIDQAEGADPQARSQAQGQARVESDTVRGGDRREVAEARIGPGIRRDHEAVAADRVVADAAGARDRPRHVDAGRLGPQVGGVDEDHEGAAHLEQAPGGAAHGVEMRLRRRAQDPERPEGRDPFVLAVPLCVHVTVSECAAR